MPATSAVQGAYLPQYTHVQTPAVPVEVGIDCPVAVLAVSNFRNGLNRTQRRINRKSNICIKNRVERESMPRVVFNYEIFSAYKLVNSIQATPPRLPEILIFSRLVAHFIPLQSSILSPVK